MKNYLKEYLTFTKRERMGIITLTVLILICTAFPWFFAGPLPPDKKSVEQFKELVAQWRLLAADSTHAVPVKDSSRHYDRKQWGNSFVLFEFDPNTLNEAGWKKLGLPDKVIRIVRNYINHGGRFRKPEDLARIYGLRKEIYDRLLPYVQISADTSLSGRLFNQSIHLARKKPKERPLIDINNCDTAVLIELPGIGSKLAQRIINFRDRLGGFYSADQVGEVYGLPDSTFQFVRKWLICPETALKRININTADVNTLRQHPYIKWNLATAIVRFREQHGLYKSPDELLQIVIITPEIFKKIVFYLAVE